MATITNINNSNQIVSRSPAEENYQMFLSVKPLIEPLKDLDRMVDNIHEAKEKYQELKDRNFFVGRNSIYTKVIEKKIDTMESLLDTDCKLEDSCKLYDTYGAIMDILEKVREG